MTPTPMCLVFVVGLGGHVEPGESAVDAAARESREEAGVVLDRAALAHAGSVRFRFPSRSSWDQDVEVFLAGATDDVLVPSDEITPAWYPVDRLPLASMWDDARYWLPAVLDGGRVDATITFAADNRTVEATEPVLVPIALARARPRRA